MKDELIYARWATNNEVIEFYNYLNNQKKSKNNFTTRWLADHGSVFIELHSRFNDEYSNYKMLQSKEGYLVARKEYLQKQLEHNQRKSNLQLCACGFNEQIITLSNGFEFIGCKNYTDTNFIHTRIYPPHEPHPYYLEYKYEPSSQYLTHLKSFYDLPKQLKNSILAEFLRMSGVELLYDIDKITKIGPEVSANSKKRENLVKPILEQKFDKVSYQRMIKAKFKYSSKTTFIPDFICTKGSTVYLIEQKKDIHNVDEYQIESYLQCLKFIIDQSGKYYDLQYFIIIEFGESNLEKSVINFKDLSSYELH